MDDQGKALITASYADRLTSINADRSNLYQHAISRWIYGCSVHRAATQLLSRQLEAKLNITFPLHRFEEFGQLSPKEKTALADLGSSPKPIDKGRLIRAEGVVPGSFYLLLSGWAAASHIMPDGRRQILKIHLPGDALGTPSMSMSRTVEELTALTNAVVVEIPLPRFGQLFTEHPRIAARFMLSIQLERVTLMDRLASAGRTSAESRVAAFLLDLMERLKPLQLVSDDSFDMLLTQEHIADVLGLTAVHVNRMLRNLTNQGLIRRSGVRVTVLDRSSLARVAMRSTRELATDHSWLPAATS